MGEWNGEGRAMYSWKERQRRIQDGELRRCIKCGAAYESGDPHVCEWGWSGWFPKIGFGGEE